MATARSTHGRPVSICSMQSNKALVTSKKGPQQSPRRFSSTDTSASASTSTKPAPVRDFFLDNLGKIFLGIIATIIGSLIRSSYGNNNLKAVRDELEEAASLDPLEIDELRKANTELTPELFRTLVKELYATNATKQWTYPDFVKQVRIVMQRNKGEGCTVGMGHLLDRVVISVLQTKNKNQQSAKDTNNDETSLSTTTTTDDMDEIDTMPLSFWFTVLSLALNGPVPDRIRILYEVLEMERRKTSADVNDVNQINDDNEDNKDHNETVVTLQDVIDMVGYLQETCQLVPDKQVIPTETKYPTQQYRRGTPQELVQWEAATSDLQEEILDLDAFADVLRSKSVCCWGECYHRKHTNVSN